MGRKRFKVEHANGESPMAAMIDVVFLLLIYFIVVQKPIIDSTELDVTLPGPENRQSATPPARTPFIVEVREFLPGQPQKDAELYGVSGQLLKLDQLRQIFEQSLKGDDKSSLLISCAPESRHQKLISLLDVCTQTGLKNVSVINQ